jgi:galacturan 1,4-alpha-galacturonidase
LQIDTSDITIQNLYCNGSHGISVGSLGNIPDKPDYVTNLFVQNVTCDNCQNGARIKTVSFLDICYYNDNDDNMDK